jgi:aspartyl protease family protein
MGDGHFLARGLVNGTPVTMLVDTGASSTVLTANDARRAGIDIAALSFTVPITTANGPATAARATVREIRVGEIARHDMTVLVAGPAMLGQSLLGMSFINTLSGFDMRGDRLTLID